jgi:hypothetical protein
MQLSNALNVQPVITVQVVRQVISHVVLDIINHQLEV